MKQFEYTIKDKFGIHARPAGLLVKKVADFQSTVTVSKDSKEADAKKIFALMGLGARFGDTIVISVEGIDEDSAVTDIEEFLKVTW